MTYQELVEKLQQLYAKTDASKIKEHVAIQFNVTGEASGALYLEVTEGKLYIQPYQYFDRDILVTISEENLLAVAEGKLDIVEAYGSGMLTAEGNLGKALLLKELVNKEGMPEKTVGQKVGSAVATAKAVAKATKSTKNNRKRAGNRR